MCQKFLEYIRKGPQDFLRSASEVFSDNDSGELLDAKQFKKKMEKLANNLGRGDSEEMQVEL